MDFDEFIKEIEDISSNIKCLKRRSMIYQVQAKEDLAKKHNKPINSYYDLTFDEWMRISSEEGGDN